jgi:uncharacterized protein (DUF2267 family)
MSEPGLEVFESTLQKTQLWLKDLAEAAHVDKPTAYKALRSVLHAIRDRLPVEEAAHFAAELPLLIRGVYYEGWRPAATPVKFSRDEFLRVVQTNIVSSEVIDPLRITRAVFEILNKHLAPGEIKHVLSVLPKELQALWPAPAQ